MEGACTRIFGQSKQNMTKHWKQVEMQVAKFFNSTRTPLSGGNGKITRSDSLHPLLFIECKYGLNPPKTWKAIAKLYDETREKAEVEHKFPVVVIKTRGTAANVAFWDAYIRGWDGAMNETLMCVPLWVVKEALEEGTLPGSPAPKTETEPDTTPIHDL
jgi:hypothetical protein